MRDPIPLKGASERIALKQIRARDDIYSEGPRLLRSFGMSEHRWNARYGDRDFVEDQTGHEAEKSRAENDVIEAIRSTFASGAWLAWGVAIGAALGASTVPIGVDDWKRATVIDYAKGRILLSQAGGWEAIVCAPLLSEAAKLRTPELLAGRTLAEVFECFVAGDPEVQGLFAFGRKDSEQEHFGDAFTRRGAMDLTLPLSDPQAIAAALGPVIADMMQERSAELLGALAARVDALAALLGSLRLNWEVKGDPRVATLLDNEFDREHDRLRLLDFTLVRGDNDANPIIDIAFPSTAELAALESPERRKQVGSPPIYRDPLLGLLREVAKDPSRARGFDTKNAIYGEIANRAMAAKPSRTLTAKTAAKAFPLEGNEFEHAAMELVISIAKGLE
jgi:hypothetical protein